VSIEFVVEALAGSQMTSEVGVRAKGGWGLTTWVTIGTGAGVHPTTRASVVMPIALSKCAHHKGVLEYHSHAENCTKASLKQ
jgi:hypothetical protein